MVELKWVEDGDNIALYYRTIKLDSLMQATNALNKPIVWTEWMKVLVEPKSKIFDS